MSASAVNAKLLAACKAALEPVAWAITEVEDSDDHDEHPAYRGFVEVARLLREAIAEAETSPREEPDGGAA